MGHLSPGRRVEMTCYFFPKEAGRPGHAILFLPSFDFRFKEQDQMFYTRIKFS